MLEIRKYEQIIKKKKGSTSLILKHISYLLLFDTAKISIIFHTSKYYQLFFYYSNFPLEGEKISWLGIYLRDTPVYTY